MPTEPHSPTLSEVVRRAVEICEPDGLSEDLERYVLTFEDRDEPIRSIEDIQGEAFDVIERWAEDPVDPAVWVAAAVTTYLGFRTDEFDRDDTELLQLAARSEYHRHPAPEVEAWLEERGVSVR